MPIPTCPVCGNQVTMACVAHTPAKPARAKTVILAGKKPAIQQAWIKYLNDAGIEARLLRSGTPDGYSVLGVEVSPEIATRWEKAHDVTRGLRGDAAIQARLAVLLAD